MVLAPILMGKVDIMKIGFARVLKLTDFWGQVIKFITGGPYRHTEIVFSKEATEWYVNHLQHRSKDYYNVWLRKSEPQIMSARRRSGIGIDTGFIAAIDEGDLRLCFSSSAQDGGVRLKLIDLEPAKWDFISCEGDLDLEKGVMPWCERLSGKKYDFLGLAGFVFCHLKLFKPHPNKWWCSEITENVLYLTRHLVGPRIQEMPNCKTNRPPSPFALWKRLSRLPQPLQRQENVGA